MLYLFYFPHWWAIFLGLLLDFMLGEPQNPLHPVRLMGKWVQFSLRFKDRVLARNFPCQFLFGVLLWFGLVVITYGIVYLLSGLGYSLGYIPGILLDGLLIYFCLSAKGLAQEGQKIMVHLRQSDLSGARRALSYIVGRDTDQADEEAVIKATVETISENFCDGVVAPLFYILLGGPALGMAYKAVNTLDSMVGYKNVTYRYIGKFSARMDDLWNFIPARIAAVLLLLNTALCGQNFLQAFQVYCRDRYKHQSPNSAHCEAVCAGSLGIRLGGTHCYGGIAVEKPYIGNHCRKAEIDDIKRTITLLYGGTLVGLFLALTLSGLWQRFYVYL